MRLSRSWSTQTRASAYYAPGQTQPKEGLGLDGDSNMLMYLEMMQNTQPPKERSIALSGHWTTPSIPALMCCISRYVFWENYQLRSRALGPLLVALNQYTWIEAVQCTASYHWGSGNYYYQIGYLYPHNDFFFFQ